MSSGSDSSVNAPTAGTGEGESADESPAAFHARLATLIPGRGWLTPTLLVANVLVYVAMLASGVDPRAPTVESLLRWGANYSPRDFGGEWWRLITAMFVHLGPLHLALNMWVLLQIGRFMERILGSAGMLVVYLLSGATGSLATILWNPQLVSAGASGAIFGLYGVLLGLLVRSRRAFPLTLLVPLRRSAIAFLGYNVASALMNPKVDLAAHCGGLAGGVCCGLVILFQPTEEGVRRTRRRLLVLGFAGPAILTLFVAFVPRPARVRKQIATEVYNSGVHAEHGRGVPKDEALAAKLYRQACDAGEPLGCINLGTLFASGRGVPRDDVRALGLYLQACESGAALGCSNAGVVYANGKGVAADLPRAARLYQRACDTEPPRGCTNLALLYEKGSGVRQDLATSVALYQKSCDGGDMAACVNLGLDYSRGRGVPQDNAKAAAFAKRACEGGSAIACNNLGTQYERGEGVEKDLTKAQSLYQQSCDSGAAPGCRNLGVLHERGGEGVSLDWPLAAQLYVKACQSKDQLACDRLHLLCSLPASMPVAAGLQNVCASAAKLTGAPRGNQP